MTEKEIIDFNKLIFNSPFCENEYTKKKYNDAFYLSVLKYHSSYDWLMPVVKKIMEWAVDDSTVSDFKIHAERRLIIATAKFNIEELYKATIECIKLFNNVTTAENTKIA